MQRFITLEMMQRSKIGVEFAARVGSSFLNTGETSASFCFAGFWAYEGDLHFRGCKMNFSLAGCHLWMQTKN